THVTCVMVSLVSLLNSIGCTCIAAGIVSVCTCTGAVVSVKAVISAVIIYEVVYKLFQILLTMPTLAKLRYLRHKK
ncbi:MAG: hypothetical protein ACK5X3_15855, partial [Pseudomonadota bacterium]